MAARARLIAATAALASAGCSFLFPFTGLQQPCNSQGICTPGYTCENMVCVPTGPVGAECNTDADCAPAGACYGGGCQGALVAWNAGSPVPPLTSCFPWPPPPSAGNDPVPVVGCITDFFGNSLASFGKGATVQAFEDGIAVTAAAGVTAQASCQSGYGYALSVPPGQLLDLVVSGAAAADGGVADWPPTHNPGVEVAVGGESGAAPQRDLGAVSSAEAMTQLSAADAGLVKNIDPSVDGVVIGVVRDCAGNPLSGVSLQVPVSESFSIAFYFLNAAGTVLYDRSATDSSGSFGAVGVAGAFQLEFTLPSGGQTDAGFGVEVIATIPITIAPGQVTFLDLAPEGP